MLEIISISPILITSPFLDQPVLSGFQTQMEFNKFHIFFGGEGFMKLGENGITLPAEPCSFMVTPDDCFDISMREDGWVVGWVGGGGRVWYSLAG